MTAPTVLALGDSVTVGVGDVGAPTGWAAHLADAVGSAHFVNVATNGARARDVSLRQLPVAGADLPHLTTLLVGGNDVLRADFNPHEVAWHVGRAAGHARSLDSDVLVVLLPDPRHTIPAPRMVRRVLASRAFAANDAISRNLRGRGRVAILDPRDVAGMTDARLWHIDRMHPSALGHRVLAEAALDCLASLGWTPRKAIPDPPDIPSSKLRQAAWLVRNGVPWFAKRSTDLLPELLWTCWKDSRAQRERRQV